MPVVVFPCDQYLESVTKWTVAARRRDDVEHNGAAEDPTPAHGLFKQACPKKSVENCKELLQSSFGDINLNDVLPAKNGFVHTVLTAYNDHHALELRPDDIWIAILSQFNLFVNANAERLRHVFVKHEGKKELEVVFENGSRYDGDIEWAARTMGDLMRENITDPTLHDWVTPNFSTTTMNDVTIASMLMMATLKEYFSFKMSFRCGIPKVTLLGEKEDWVNLLERIERLKTFNEIQLVAWYHLLRPILEGFVKCFDEPKSKEVADFWNRVSSRAYLGSGVQWVNGWITAFCVFTEKGKWAGHPLKGETDSDFASLTSAQFTAQHYDLSNANEKMLKLGDTLYPRVDSQDIPPSITEVDVLVDDNGEIFYTSLAAGSVASQVQGEERNSVTPLNGWWLYVKHK